LEGLVRTGRCGPYVQLGSTEKVEGKPKTASLFKSMSPTEIDIDQALLLLSLPRPVGDDPESGEPILARNGRYGPYLTKGDDSRSLEEEDHLFTVTLEEAVALFAQPKRRRGQKAAAPLRDLGVDPATGCTVVVKDGRFGPYVTDGSVNASLRRDDAVDKITIERASELLAMRRDKLVAEGKEVKPCSKAESPDGVATDA